MFDFRKVVIDDQDIEKVERALGITFNDEQRKVIKFCDNSDIQACPGSGKTTTLAAKLVIIASKLPQDFKHGICIITHTNIAVKEIKEKLGAYANFYLKYPNHFGTIQSFVDKYLAIPAYKNMYKHSPNIVDDETYGREIKKLTVLKATGTLNFLELKNVEPGYLSFNKQAFIVAKNVNDSAAFSISGISAPKWEAHYNRIVSAKQTLLRDGYLKYDEAYSLGFKYLRENPKLKLFFALRFPIVFIDEMQDMEAHQAEIIDELFGSSNSVIQKIGDGNQAIFSRSDSEGAKDWKPVINADLQLKKSHRIADNVAELVKDICVSPQSLDGWKNPIPIKPTIIVYSDTTILKVKETFAELLIKYDLTDKGSCKCIGSRIGSSKLNINSYWQEFNRARVKSEHPNLISHVNYIKKLLKKNKNIKEVSKVFLEIFCKILKFCKVKNPINTFYFTPFTLVLYLYSLENQEKINEINKKISIWVVRLLRNENIEEDLVEYIQKFINYFSSSETDESIAYISDKAVNPEEEKIESKIFSYSKDGKSVDLHFDTIHGVKGETHTATLYLESFLRIYDIGGKILNFITSDDKGKAKLRKDPACKRQLPLAYVALTRATHFIAIAIHKDRFEDHHQQYFEHNSQNWDVIHL